MSDGSDYIRPAPVWSAQVGANATTSDAFIGGTITLTATTATRLLVLFYQAGNIGGRISSITIGGVTPTTAAQVDGYYAFTMPVSTSGTTLTVSGVAASTFGRSVWRAYELSGYSSATPAIVMSAPAAAPVSSWSAMTSSNMATGGLFEGTGTLGVSEGSAPSVIQINLEGGLYNNFIQGATSRGPVTYTPGSTTRYLFVAWR
jgi:hypothetical protein